MATIKRQFVNDEAPEIIFLESKINEIENQIQLEKDALYNNSGNELNAKAIELRNIQGDLDFKNDLYISSLSIQENARIDSIKQKRFITQLIKPYIPKTQNFKVKNKLFISTIILISLIYYLFVFIFGSVKSNIYR